MRLKQLEILHNSQIKTTPSQEKQYFIYARKSEEAEDRQVQSIGDQLQIAEELKARLNITTKETFSESRSAKMPGRQEFNRMIEAIDNMGGIQGIIVWKLNRLFRNPEDEGKIRQRLSDGRIKEIITPSKTYYEADSDFIMAVEGAQAQRFIRDLREDTARGIKSKLNKGIAPILAPPGYKNDITKRQGERDIVPDPVQFPLVKLLFEHYMTGNYSVQQLYFKAQELGVRSSRGKIVSKTQLYQMLRNPFYTGIRFIYGGKLYTNGIHQRMITDAEFDLIQGILDGRSKPRAEVHTDLLTGLMRCGECGRMITAEVQTKQYKNGTSQTFVYYRCTKKWKGKKCSQPYVPAKKLEEQVINYLESITLSAPFAEWAIKWLKVMHANQEEIRTAKYKAVEQSYNEVVKKINRVVEMTLSEMLTTEEGMEMKKTLEQEKQKLLQELSQMDTHVSDWSTLAIQTFDFVKNIRERFTNGTIEQKKTILRLIGSNLIIIDKKIDITIRNPFEYIQKAVAELNDGKRLEPKELPDITVQEAFLLGENSKMGDRRDLNPQPPGPQPGAPPIELRPPINEEVYIIAKIFVFVLFSAMLQSK